MDDLDDDTWRFLATRKTQQRDQQQRSSSRGGTAAEEQQQQRDQQHRDQQQRRTPIGEALLAHERAAMSEPVVAADPGGYADFIAASGFLESALSLYVECNRGSEAVRRSGSESGSGGCPGCPKPKND